MATTPTEPGPGPDGPGARQYGYLPGTGNAFASLPIPGNAELVVFIVVELVIAIVAATTDAVTAVGWVDATQWIAAAYLISRGIAKASRVLEQ